MSVVMSSFAVSSSCDHCALNQLCAVNDSSVPVSIASLVKQRFKLKRGEVVANSRKALETFYAVRAGAVKMHGVGAHQKEKINHFYLPGEIIGFEAMHAQHYKFTASAITETQICKIPAKQLFSAMANSPQMQLQIVMHMSRRINMDLCITQSSAEQKVIGFLLEVQERLHCQSHSPFILPFSRVDIGNFLGLAAETITRIFTDLQQRQLIQIEKKSIQLLNFKQLKNIVQS